MNIYYLKNRIKSIPLINKVYAKLIGNRKVENIERKKRDALQSYGFEVLGILDSLLTDNGFQYFLNFGSLLGIIRDGAFMRHDDDIDLGIYINGENDWERIETILKEREFKLVRQFVYQGKIEEQTYKYNDLLIDFFHQWNNDNYTQLYGFFRKKDYVYKSPNDAHVSLISLYKLDEFKRVEYCDTEFVIPKYPELYLESFYSTGWRTPDPTWSAQKMPAWKELSGEMAVASYLE